MSQPDLSGKLTVFIDHFYLPYDFSLSGPFNPDRLIMKTI